VLDPGHSAGAAGVEALGPRGGGGLHGPLGQTHLRTRIPGMSDTYRDTGVSQYFWEIRYILYHIANHCKGTFDILYRWPWLDTIRWPWLDTIRERSVSVSLISARYTFETFLDWPQVPGTPHPAPCTLHPAPRTPHPAPPPQWEENWPPAFDRGLFLEEESMV
jgi:hypothetical protein